MKFYFVPLLLPLIFVVSAKSAISPLFPEECGRPGIQPITTGLRIVGGITARPHSWPWQAQIWPNDGMKGEALCGGSLINNQVG